ncbi:MAG: hypothetical protein LBT31_03525 [Synergistaceae bacterium]|nr:hypothetical protein [Synergistaceae bacterium]
MLRPIDSTISILNTDQKMHQVKDPGAHQVQVVQQDEIAKRIQHEAQSVQHSDKTDEDTKIKDRGDRNKGDRRNKKKRGQSQGADEQEAVAAPSEKVAAPGGGFNFLA